MKKKGQSNSLHALAEKGSDLALWLAVRYKGEVWFRKLGKSWNTNARMVRFFLVGQRNLKATTLYLIQQTTGIPMARMMEQSQHMGLLLRQERRKDV